MIELTLDVREPVAAATVAFGMNASNGQRVVTLESDSEGKPLSLHPGRAIVRMSLDCLSLSPGRYSCDASIVGAVAFDLIENFAEWEVLPGRNDWKNDFTFKGCRLRPVVEFLGAEP